MTRTSRTRLVFAIGGFVALTILVPSTVRGSLPGEQALSSDVADGADLGAALRVELGSEIAATISAPFDVVWSQASSRGRFSLPVADLENAALIRAALVALVLTAIASVRTNWLVANASDPRAPPLLLQRQ